MNIAFAASLADKIKGKYAELVRDLPIEEYNAEMRDILLTLSRSYGYNNLDKNK